MLTWQGRLALLVLLDQVPRNIFRGTAGAFERDPAALALALRALQEGDDRQVHPMARSFIYLPLVHAEDMAMQDRAVSLFAASFRAARHFDKAIVGMEYMGSLRHRQIIRRFGRYPHRNDALGRDTTPEESRFLRQPLSSF